MIDDIPETVRPFQSGAPAQAAVTAFFESRAEAETAADRLRAMALGSVTVTEGAGGSGLTDAGDTSTTGDGSDSRGFFEKLGDFFFPEEDRSTYAEGLSRGGYLVTVTGLSPADHDDAMDALEECGAVDIDERAESWRAAGWTGSRDTMTADAGAGHALRGGGDTLPLAEEHLRVGKRDVSHGRVRVRTYVVEEPVSETVRLQQERVEIDRRPVDRPVDPATQAADDLFRERSIEAEEFREEAVVSKEARIVGEVALRRSRDSHDETVSDTLRHTEVEVDDDRGAARNARISQYEAETGRPEEDADDPDATGLTDRPRP